VGGGGLTTLISQDNNANEQEEEMKRCSLLSSGLALVAAVALFAVGAAQADVSQTPNVTGCPAGYELLSIAVLEASGPYPDSVFGGIDRAGNDNGYICGNPQPTAVLTAYCRQGAEIACELEQLGLPHYVLKDDNNPASQTAKVDQ
jgi:hypothetical protein